MYVDESGDAGMLNSPSRYFVLSGLVVHEHFWSSTIDRLMTFRQRMRDIYGLKLREEIHSAAFVRGTQTLSRIQKHDRLELLRHFADELAANPNVSAINVVVDKQGKESTCDAFEMAWEAIILKFEQAIGSGQLSGPGRCEDRGLILPDGQPIKKLNDLVRRLRSDGADVPRSRDARSCRILVEDPIYRDSQQSLMIQAADLCAYLLHQRLAPNAYMQKKGRNRYFERLSPILFNLEGSAEVDGPVPI